jgi:hypothetical protein
MKRNANDKARAARVGSWTPRELALVGGASVVLGARATWLLGAMVVSAIGAQLRDFVLGEERVDGAAPQAHRPVESDVRVDTAPTSAPAAERPSTRLALVEGAHSRPSLAPPPPSPRALPSVPVLKAGSWR